MKASLALLVFSVIIGASLLTVPFIAPTYLTTIQTTTKSTTTTVQETSLGTITITQLFFPCKGTALCWQGVVTNIIDGDTIRVGPVQIRLGLVNAPSLNQPNGIAAKDFVGKICPIGSKAVIDQDDRQLEDSYGRIIASVWCGGKNLNAELLNAGLAKIDTRFCTVSEFAAEDWAKKYGCP